MKSGVLLRVSYGLSGGGWQNISISVSNEKNLSEVVDIIGKVVESKIGFKFENNIQFNK